MRIPRTPPKTAELLKDVARDKGAEFLLEIERLAPEPKKYLHWDKLRHLAPPDGLTHHEWWLGLKMRRFPSRRTVPLCDKEQRPFSFTLHDPIPEYLHDIDLRGGGSIGAPDPLTNPGFKNRYLLRSLIEEAITSSQLEGAATTRLVAKEMLRVGRPPRNLHEQMILNNFLTMQEIGKIREQPLSPELVCHLHRIVTTDTLDDPADAGRLRSRERSIAVEDDYGNVFHRPPPAGELPARLEAMSEFANAKSPEPFVHPVVRSIVLHFWLGYDHPFVDGNGRTARALFYWSMLHYGYWFCEFISISEIIRKAPSKYERAFLYTETDENDLTYFLIHQLETIRRAMDTVYKYVEHKTKEIRDLERRSVAIASLNHRQQAIISHALRHPHHCYSIESHRKSHGVVYQTARVDLLNLVERKFLESTKVGREYEFVSPADLGDRLKMRDAGAPSSVGLR